VRHRHENRPAVITDAPENLDDEFDRRRRRYAIMMSMRALCVIAAALTYRFSWILAVGFIVGGAILPWCAVIIANDRPPKRSRRWRRYHGESGGKQLASRQKALPASRDDRTIDG
jgi:hypothetical protein